METININCKNCNNIIQIVVKVGGCTCKNCGAVNILPITFTVHQIKNEFYFILSKNPSPRADDNLIAESIGISEDALKQVMIDNGAILVEGFGLVFKTREDAQKCIDDYIKPNVKE